MKATWTSVEKKWLWLNTWNRTKAPIYDISHIGNSGKSTSEKNASIHRFHTAWINDRFHLFEIDANFIQTVYLSICVLKIDSVGNCCHWLEYVHAQLINKKNVMLFVCIKINHVFTLLLCHTKEKLFNYRWKRLNDFH